MRTQSPLRIRALNELIQGFLAGLIKLGYNPVRAVLFGSYAKECPHADSDVDLAIWLQKTLSLADAESPAMLRHRSLHYPISPKFFESGESSDDDPFIEEILNTGKEITLPDILNTYNFLMNEPIN